MRPRSDGESVAKAKDHRSPTFTSPSLLPKERNLLRFGMFGLMPRGPIGNRMS